MRRDWPTFTLPLTGESEFVPVDDDVLVPRRIEGATFTYLAEDDDSVVVSVTVDAEMVDGQPVCTRLVVEGGTRHVTRTLLAEVDPLWFARMVLSGGGFRPGGKAGTWVHDAVRASDALQRLPRRRTVNSARLAEVAEAYQRGGADAVVHDCHVSRSQAFRLVKQAREAGQLPAKETSS